MAPNPTREVVSKGRYWDFFRWCFVNRKVVKGDQQGVVVFRPINAGMLKEPRAEERFEVVWQKGDGRYNVLDTTVYSYQELLPMLTDEFICTQNTPAMVSELLIPLQEKNWDVTSQEYQRLKQQVHRQGRRVAEQIKAAAAFLERSVVEANIKQYGEDFYAKPSGAKSVKRQQQQTEKQAHPGKKLKQGRDGNDTISQAAAAAKSAGGGTAAATTAKPAAKSEAAAARSQGKVTKQQPSAAGKSTAAAKAAAKTAPPKAAVNNQQQTKKQQQKNTTTGHTVAAEETADDFVDAEDGSGAEDADSPSVSEEETSSDDFNDSDDSEMEQEEHPSRLQPPRAAQQQQKSKRQQQDTPAAAAKKRRRVAEPAETDVEGTSDQEFQEALPRERKQQQQQQQQRPTPNGKGKVAAVAANAGKAGSKQRKLPAAAAAAGGSRAVQQGAASSYKGWTGREYPTHLCYQPGDHKLGSAGYDGGYSQEVEYTVETVLDEVEVKIGSRRDVKVLVKWQGFELDVHAWEPAGNFSATEAYIKWKSQQKPTYYSAVAPSAASKAFKAAAGSV